jgi:hypothetical protein
MFGNFSSKPKLKKAIYDEIAYGNPIEPEYGVTESLTPNNERCLGASDKDFVFYENFEGFDKLINLWFEDTSFRLEEHNYTRVDHLSDDEPRYGRTYAIFYNKIEIGLIEVADSSVLEAGMCTFYIEISGNLIEYIPYKNLFSFLSSIGKLLVSQDALEQLKFSLEITSSMHAAIWQRDLDGKTIIKDIVILFSSAPYYLVYQKNRKL